MDCRPSPRAAALLFPLALAVAPAALAVNLTNGDFATGDFFGWTRDTDGGPGGSPDFSIVGPAGAYAARLEADYWSDPGNTASTPRNTVLFANTLVQELDTTLSPGGAMRLTFDWLFTGEDGDPASGDTFSVALNDGRGNLYGADGLASSSTPAASTAAAPTAPCSTGPASAIRPTGSSRSNSASASIQPVSRTATAPPSSSATPH